MAPAIYMLCSTIYMSCPSDISSYLHGLLSATNLSSPPAAWLKASDVNGFDEKQSHAKRQLMTA